MLLLDSMAKAFSKKKKASDHMAIASSLGKMFFPGFPESHRVD